MHGRLFPGLVILTTAISVGCGGASVGFSRTGDGTTVAASELAVSPRTLNFGQVAVGTAKGQSVTLTAGEASITVRSAAWSGEGYSVSGIVFPTTIPAGQTADLRVTFAPQSAGSAPGNIQFVSDAENTPQVAFSGNGTQEPVHNVTLTWRSPAGAVVGYNVYRGTASEGPYTKITGSPEPNVTFTDASVVGGETYFYMATAVYTDGKESKNSNQVRVTIPSS
jgi:hypothetical protein